MHRFAGWEEGTFPSKVATGRLDEEYRLAYVALTRCRKLAAITYSRRRLQRGRWRRREPSAFLQVCSDAMACLAKAPGVAYVLEGFSTVPGAPVV